MQWLNQECVIYNTISKGNMVSQITNINSLQSRMLDFPIDSISKNGTLASSFSYERLEKYMPGYGYPYKDSYSFIENKAPNETGMYLIDMKNNSRKLIVDVYKRQMLGKPIDCSADSPNITLFLYQTLISFRLII